MPVVGGEQLKGPDELLEGIEVGDLRPKLRGPHRAEKHGIHAPLEGVVEIDREQAHDALGKGVDDDHLVVSWALDRIDRMDDLAPAQVRDLGTYLQGVALEVVGARDQCPCTDFLRRGENLAGADLRPRRHTRERRQRRHDLHATGTGDPLRDGVGCHPA